MKKYLLIGLGLVLIGGGIFVYSENNTKPVINQGLSDRSKKFIATQKDSDQWRYTNLENKKKEDSKDQTINVEKCFSFTMPFSVRFSRVDGECNVAYGVTSPRATVVIYKRESQIESFDGVPGVSMRRLYSDKYKEEEKTLGGKKFLIFTQKEEEALLSAFYFEPEFHFVANVIGVNDDSTKKEFMRLLESVKFYNEN